MAKNTAAAGAARRHRASVATRTLAGTLGAYGLTVQVTVVLSFLLARAGMDRAEAVTAATLASFAIFAGISMAAFHASSAGRAWVWLAMTAAPLALLGWGLGPVR
ncbi:hypothetical protein [Novosphingobium sp. P6W]|uniref:hypothetical protein n=1 Tax=Novosphingobium sp. P6W TaxID=1609758 RepID=UPI0005C2F73F|nr:hypothetical protein [Novosphingobium sp. P6W]KIS32294.1 hypothetical protein TQ38_11580 [Novosphingobium sp. P6W]